MEKSIRNKILSKIPYGLYVVGAKTGDGVAAIIANWVGQVSFEPPLVSISIERDSDMKAYIEESKHFSVNMLANGSTQIAKVFLKKSKPVATGLHGREITIGKHGSPFLKEAVAALECKVVNCVRAGDHTLFMGEVTDGVWHSDEQILTLNETGWKYNR